MSRSSWKGPYIAPQISRSSTILPIHVGMIYKIHNGKTLSLIKIKEEMVGHKFGEYYTTKTHGSKN